MLLLHCLTLDKSSFQEKKLHLIQPERQTRQIIYLIMFFIILKLYINITPKLLLRVTNSQSLEYDIFFWYVPYDTLWVKMNYHWTRQPLLGYSTELLSPVFRKSSFIWKRCWKDNQGCKVACAKKVEEFKTWKFASFQYLACFSSSVHLHSACFLFYFIFNKQQIQSVMCLRNFTSVSIKFKWKTHLTLWDSAQV